jgi:hypothetical protein
MYAAYRMTSQPVPRTAHAMVSHIHNVGTDKRLGDFGNTTDWVPQPGPDSIKRTAWRRSGRTSTLHIGLLIRGVVNATARGEPSGSSATSRPCAGATAVASIGVGLIGIQSQPVAPFHHRLDELGPTQC